MLQFLVKVSCNHCCCFCCCCFVVVVNIFTSSSTLTSSSSSSSLLLTYYHYTPAQQSWRGGILDSPCPSVRLYWHFIAATAIKPPKAACQFAADDILLYKICYNIQWIYFTIWEKGKEELSPLQYHFKSLHIISRHYKKSLLRSQIYHGYEELSTDTNYPIWRRQKLPYMKKTRKKKQVCGAACFMAAEIKFSEDVRPSVCRRHGFWSISQVCFGISISNFICMLMVAIGRSLLIFSDGTFKMAAWRQYWIFWFPD